MSEKEILAELVKIRDRIDIMNEHLGEFLRGLKEAKATFPEVEKTLQVPGFKKLPRDLNKGEFDFNKEHVVAKKVCSRCGGAITWEYRPDISWPVHVDPNTKKILGNGTCPEYGG